MVNPHFYAELNRKNIGKLLLKFFKNVLTLELNRYILLYESGNTPNIF